MKNATLIALVVDRSGSISQCLAAMQSAVDEFIEGQKKEPGECELALFQFDDVYEPVFRKSINDAPKYKIVPRSMTALHDAIGKTVNDIGSELEKTKDEDKPEKILICVITDGLENSSKEFNAKQIAEMVKHQQEKYDWNFVFLGANQDAVLTAAQYNIPAGRAMSFATTDSGIRGMSASLGNYTRSLRQAPTASAGRAVKFSDEDRKKAMRKK